jgi:hypothetical protein
MMSNLQLYLAVGLPTFAVVSSLVMSMFQMSGMREDMRELRREMNNRSEIINGKIDILTGKVYELMAK